MAWPPDDAVSRRDEALHRTRRISLGTAGGALAATAVLGLAFARSLPGHSAVAVTASGASGQAAAGTGAGGTGSPAASPHHARSHRHKRHTQASGQPAPAPVPPSTPPQVVSGGS